MRGILAVDREGLWFRSGEARRRLAAAMLLLAAGCCLLLFLAFGFSRESFAALLLPLLIGWFVILAVARPANALTVYALLAVTTMPFQFLILRGKSVAGGIFLSQVLLAALLAGLFMRAAARREPRARRLSHPLLCPLLGLAVVPFVSILSAYVTWDPEVPILHRKLIVQFAGASLIFLAAAAVLLPYAIISHLSQVKAIVAVMVILSASSFLDLVFGLSRSPGRSLIYTTAPLAFSFALHAPSHLRRLLWLTLLVPPFLFAIQAIKITLLVAIIASVLFISLAHSRRAFLMTLGALVAGYLILGFALGRPPAMAVYEKAKRVKDFDRVLLFQKAASTWKEHPLFGVGPGGQFAYLGGEHFYGTAHSLYGNFLLETGLIGTIFLLWTLGAAISLGWKTYRAIPPPGGGGQPNSEAIFVRAFALGQTGGLLGMAVAGLFSDTLLPAVQNGGMYAFGATVYTWLLLGITAALRRMQSEGSPPIGSRRPSPVL